MIADKLIELQIIDDITDSTVCSTMKKQLNPWLIKEWCIPESKCGICSKNGGHFFGGYQRPFDPLCPVVCIDEMHRQLLEETRIPCEADQPEKVDSEYVRKEVMDVFMIAEPLAGKRDTIVTQTRTAIDFSRALQYTSDILFPQAEKIVLVTDNLNTHMIASLYKAFAPEEARRLAGRFEWHYTPKHGSWLAVYGQPIRRWLSLVYNYVSQKKQSCHRIFRKTIYQAQPDAPHRAGKYADNAFTTLIYYCEAG